MFTNRKCRVSMDTCKNHSGRSEKDVSRICPANLSKQELEDLYFNLFDNNMQLKTKLNSQEDQIKMLNIKVQRLAHAQRPAGRGERDCCMRNNALINEQKEMISDLKVLKERMAEKIKQLNRQLCSTKQFLKGNGALTRCTKCHLRNTSMSFVNTKSSETNLKQAVAVLSQGLDKLQIMTRSVATSVATETDDLDHKCVAGMKCENNKCRCEIEELKQRNAELEDELLRIREKHLNSESATERQMILLRQENSQLKHLNADLDQSLRDLTDSLRTVDNDRCELASQLTLEQRKVAELETRVRLSCTSSEITRVLRKHLSQKIEEQRTVAKQNRNCCCNATEAKYEEYTRTPRSSRKDFDEHAVGFPDMAPFKNSDDSGYADIVKSGENQHKNINEEARYSQPPRLSEIKNKIDAGHGPQPPRLIEMKNKIVEDLGYPRPSRPSVATDKIEEERTAAKQKCCCNATEDKHQEEYTRTPRSSWKELDELVVGSPDMVHFRNSDDSGFADIVKSGQYLNKHIFEEARYSQPPGLSETKNNSVEESRELIDKINNIQYQIDELKSDALTKQELKEASKPMSETAFLKSESSDDDELQEDSKTVIGSASQHSQNLDELDEGDKLAEMQPQIGPPVEPPREPSSNKEESIEAHWAVTPQRSLVLDLELEVPRTVRITTAAEDSSKAEAPSEQPSSMSRSNSTESDKDKQTKAFFVNVTKTQHNIPDKTTKHRKGHRPRAKSKDTNEVPRSKPNKDLKHRSKSRHRKVTGAEITPESPSKLADFARKSSRSSEGSKSRSNEKERTYEKEKIINDVMTRSGIFPTLLKPHASFPPPSRLKSISLQTYSMKQGARRGSHASRYRSPDDTDSEISSLSDLPSEKDELVQVRLSLGEERARNASTSSEPPSMEYASLSEGEVPVRLADSSLSLGEKPNSSSFNKQSKVTSPEKMQQAISAVSKEMLRCQRLIELVSQGGHESGAV